MPTIEPTFRIANASDALCVGTLATQVFLDTYATSGIREAIAREVTQQFSASAVSELIAEPRTRILLAEHEGHLIGFLQLGLRKQHEMVQSLSAAEVEKLYVQERFAGSGVGTALLREGEALAVAEGATEVWLTVWVHNNRALEFYPRRGFRDAGAVPFVLQGEHHENRLFVKALAARVAP